MTELTYREGVPQYTLEHYETDYADRHLLHGVIRKWAVETPEQIAIIDAETGNQYTYREFDEAITALALRLLNLGFGPGDFLATSLPLYVEHIFLEYACFQLGVIHAPLDLRLKEEEIVRSLEMIQAKGYVFPGDTGVVDLSHLGRIVQDQCPFVEHFIQMSPDGETIPGALAYETFAAQSIPADSDVHARYAEITAAVKPTDGAQVIYTTGSTGLPKPALLTHRNITCQNMCLGGGFNMSQAKRQLVNLPPSHVGCQAEQLMTSFFCGITAVILYVFDAEKTLRAIQEYQVDLFGQIPAMFNMQRLLPNYDSYDLSSVQAVMFGGQQVPTQFVEQVLAEFPSSATGLGLSEMAGFVTYTPVTRDVRQLTETLGWWMPVTPLTIRAPMNEDGTAGPELPDGEIGEICFSGPQVFREYVGNPEAYQRTVTRDGVCYTGDLGAKSEHGLKFSGRSKLVIKPKGYQIHPAQIEEHFSRMKEHVATCGAVGADHAIFSEGVVLFIELKPDATLSRDTLEEHAREIASYMRPSHYVLMSPGSFPLNRVAKSDYVRLREMATAEVENLRAEGGWDCVKPEASHST
ncbi:class I adenylate-forming enzyme family protein [Symmachiella dynata]|uniref:class I adenylate-forming enzyme family protein n=1 Tax=Symmachiella dynata TaxID=2527995 RepID=UPI0030EB79CD